MNILLYGIITTASILFILVILLIVTLIKYRPVVPKSSEIRCPTCGQLLEPGWNRCPFCAEPTDTKTLPTTATIPDILPVGYLIVKAGSDRGKIYKISNEKIKIGSGNYNDIIIKDRTVSPQHCQITLTERKFVITDLHSQSGTKVNNRVIEQSEIYDNDEITIGNNIFVFKVLE